MAPREDDNLSTGEVSGFGMVAACRTCLGRDEVTHAVGKSIPSVGDPASGTNRLIKICGVCRRAVRESDGAETAIRLTTEDLSDGYWGVYDTEIAAGRGLYRIAVDQARQTFEEHAAPFKAEHKEDLDGILARFQEEKDAAESAAPDEDFLRDAVSQIIVRQAQAIKDADEEYEANTAEFKYVRDAVIFRAHVAYRKASKEAFVRTAAICPIDPPKIEPGAYQVCEECLAVYKPRVHERLIRDGVIKTHEPLGQNYLM